MTGLTGLSLNWRRIRVNMHESIGEYSTIGFSQIKDLSRMIGDFVPRNKINVHIRINNLDLNGHMAAKSLRAREFKATTNLR
jgi:hypothetical protein